MQLVLELLVSLYQRRGGETYVNKHLLSKLRAMATPIGCYQITSLYHAQTLILTSVNKETPLDQPTNHEHGQ